LKTENQIDHFCISKRFRRSLQDVRVKRGAGAVTDHHIIVANVKCIDANQQGKESRIQNRTE
jgi:endonuclease/exonuclease/phosphatase family metal-dependent hydrolase